MTERPEDIAQAQSALDQGLAVAASLQAHDEAMLGLEGGGTDVTDTERSIDDQAAGSIGSSVEPPAVSPQPSSSPNLPGARGGANG